MLRSKVKMRGGFEGAYYVSNVFVDNYCHKVTGEFDTKYGVGSRIHSGEWMYSRQLTERTISEIERNFLKAYIKRFNSFRLCHGTYNHGLMRKATIIAENNYFYIGVELTRGYMVFELIQKDVKGQDKPGVWPTKTQTQQFNYKKYLEGIVTALVKAVPEVVTPEGIVTKSNVDDWVRMVRAGGAEIGVL